MVGVAQLVEPWIVIPVVVGSSPIVHPIFWFYYDAVLLKELRVVLAGFVLCFMERKLGH